MQKLAENSSDKPKWRRKPEKRPEEILDGALIEFRARGFAAARIEDIAKHAGLSKGTVYLYFSSKEEMFKALVRRRVAPIAAQLKAISEKLSNDGGDLPASQVLMNMISLIASGLGDKKVGTIPLLIIGEAGNFPEHADFYRNEVIEVSMEALCAVIQRGIDSSEFKPLEPEYAVRTLIGMLLMQVVWNGVFARKEDKVMAVDKLMQSHLDIFLNGIRMPEVKS